MDSLKECIIDLINEAYEQGYDEGYSEGFLDGEDEGISQINTDLDAEEVIEVEQVDLIVGDFVF